jgi:hypothetical protein
MDPLVNFMEVRCGLPSNPRTGSIVAAGFNLRAWRAIVG